MEVQADNVCRMHRECTVNQDCPSSLIEVAFFNFSLIF
jgi:hypothetical protein